MSITLKISGHGPVSFDDHTITIGTDTSNTLPLPEGSGVLPRHVTIRQITGRWLVEAREAEALHINDLPATRVHWLRPGDVIHLAASGPDIEFEPAASAAAPQPRVSTTSMSTTTQQKRPPVATTLPPAPTPSPATKPVLPARPVPASTAPLRPVVPQLPTAKPIPLPAIHDDDDAILLSPVKPKPATAYPAPPADEIQELPSRGAKQISESSAMGSQTELLQELSDTDSVSSRPKAEHRRSIFIAVNAVSISVLAFVAWIFLGSKPPRKESPAPLKKPEIASVSETADRSLPAVEKRRSKAPQRVPSNSDPKPIQNPDASDTRVSVARQAAPERGLGMVILRDAKNEQAFRLGTAVSVSTRHFVTSGAVVMAIDDLKSQGLTAVVRSAASGSEYAVKRARVHPIYRQAAQDAAAFHKSNSPPAEKTDAAAAAPDAKLAAEATEKLSEAYLSQVSFDVGVLDVDGPLPERLSISSAPLAQPGKPPFLLLGLPFRNEDFRQSSATEILPAQRTAAPAGPNEPAEDALHLNLVFSADVAANNWSGSAVLDSEHKVIGVYSRPWTSTETTRASSQPPPHAIIWIGRLREFAPDVK